MAVPPDYDDDPERFRLGSRITERHLSAPSLYEHLATRLTGRSTIVDIGCGEGALAAALAAATPAALPLLARVSPGPAEALGSAPRRLVGVDASATMLGAHPRPVVQAEAARLPFAADVFDAALAINMLYHLDDPMPALREARRVLAPGGLFVASAIARDDSPELAAVWRREPTPFDAEEAQDLVASVFGTVEVERWDAALITLPDRDAVRDYLIARQVPRPAAVDAAAQITTPLPVTKRGALIFACR
ncbi:class I SAM-dependent methyltransferase [Actinomadura fulvescens]|uniref:class I SAM-dependent methyltransferase n=1 Tax=Actinomadura fulvescens TaxID=46160 RepID=UPI0031D8D844